MHVREDSSENPESPINEETEDNSDNDEVTDNENDICDEEDTHSGIDDNDLADDEYIDQLETTDSFIDGSYSSNIICFT